MSDQEEIKEWEEKIKLGQRYKEEQAYAKQWSLWKRYYRNSFDVGIVPVNIIFPTIRSLVPRIYFRDPRVIVTATRPGYSVAAKIVEAVDNILLRTTRVKRAMKKMIKDGCLLGTGIGRSTFDSEFGYDAENSRIGSEEEQEFRDLGFWKEDTEFIEYNEDIMPGMPGYVAEDPEDIVVPYGCRSARSAPWIARRFVRHIDDIKADPKYENTSGLEPTHTLRAAVNKEKFDSTSGNVEYCVLWEISDAKHKQVLVFAEDYSKWLRKEQDLLQIGGLNYDNLVFNDDDSFWGLADTVYIAPQQLELNEVRTQFREHRRRDLLRLFILEQAFAEEELQKIEKGDVGAIIRVRKMDDIRNAIMAFTPSQYNNFIQASLMIESDIREMVGFSRNQLGEFDRSTRRTATEASIVHQASTIRIDERQDLVADLLVDICDRFNQYIFQFWTNDQFAEIVGPDGMLYWVPFTGPQIRGKYLISVEPDTGLPRNSAQRRQDAASMLELLMRFGPQAGSVFNVPELLKFLIEQFPMVDPARVLNPQFYGAIPQVASIESLQEKYGNANLSVQMPRVQPQMG